MGGGAVIQLIAFGVQNIQITGNPQITYFKQVYRRHTNFAMESIQQDIYGNLTPGSKVSVTIARNGDLLSNLTIQYNPSLIVPVNDGVVNTIATNFGHALFDNLEIEIGGQLIDRHYSIWLTIWRDLTTLGVSEKQEQVTANGREPYYTNLYNRMAYTHFQHFDTLSSNPDVGTWGAPTEAYVPMQFWFCRNPGLALPLIALQYHEVKFNFTLASKELLVGLYEGSEYTEIELDLTSVKVFADYIYLDTTERKRFAADSHEYLIEQLQYQSYDDNIISNNTITILLNFQHPVKELVFSGQPNKKPFYGPSGSSKGPAFPERIVYRIPELADIQASDVSNVKMNLTFNQLSRFTPRNIKYFTRSQIWENHTGAGSLIQTDSIGVYSFALRPEEHQPSGSCNFSRITNPRMVFSDFEQAVGEKLSNLDIFAVNYNVLRIMSGMGAVAFAS